MTGIMNAVTGSTGLSERATQHVIRTGRPRARGALRARLGLNGRDRRPRVEKRELCATGLDDQQD
jgi:hypothetical protein